MENIFGGASCTEERVGEDSSRACELLAVNGRPRMALIVRMALVVRMTSVVWVAR